MIPGYAVRKKPMNDRAYPGPASQLAHAHIGKIESGERRLDVVEFVAVAKALKVDPIDLFTRFVRAS